MDSFLLRIFKNRGNLNTIDNMKHLEDLIRTDIHILNEYYIQSITTEIDRLQTTYIECTVENGGHVEQFNLQSLSVSLFLFGGFCFLALDIKFQN